MSLLNNIKERSIFLALIHNKYKISVQLFVHRAPEDIVYMSTIYTICDIITNTSKILDMLYSKFDKVCIIRNEEITWEDCNQVLLKMEAIRKEIDADDLYWKT